MQKLINYIKQITELQQLALVATALFNAFVILFCKDENEYAFLCFIMSCYFWLGVMMGAIASKRRELEEEDEDYIVEVPERKQRKEFEWHEIAETVYN